MIVKLKAGLGNMMFQYAYALLQREVYGVAEVKLDKSYYTAGIFQNILDSFEQFNIRIPYATAEEVSEMVTYRKLYNPKPYTLWFRASVLFESLLNKGYYLENKKEMYYKDPIDLCQYRYIDGYWQSWKYCEPIRNLLMDDFTSRNVGPANYQQIKTEISNVESVALCIRKGDYLKGRYAKRKYYNCGIDYYTKALEYIKRKTDNPVIYVFTNDARWVKDNLIFKDNTAKMVFREGEDVFQDYLELQLIRNCKHAIISNSTFHWWGAYLNVNPNALIVHPGFWFADGSTLEIYKDSWINISEVEENDK